ncbi:DUF4430 domain-containing protein [Niameybacter massiliensis]|uniref:DUF4430 domain-containing protein n=1 Tax=Holtiella tumoricola TaxID=3018743 RepID=A0AA42DK75_9FIRM|nr:DUF4430 domain-containing protein [Holtiella tumoricola]MDA3730377.1 DUF4430 domain-containing protein [Holtiella tumoricola]
MNNLLPLAALGLFYLNHQKASYRQSDSDTMPITFSVLGPSAATILLPPTPEDVTIGDSVLQASIEVFTNQNIPYVLGGKNNNAYITSINNITQNDYGSSSRWFYKVNGTFSSLPPTDYTLKSGDIVEWLYTTNDGIDIGVPFKNTAGKNNTP